MIADPFVLSITVFSIMFLFLLSGLWIGFSLMAAGVAGMLLADLNLPPGFSVWTKIGNLLVNSMWNSVNSWSLTALPLFVFMGELLHRTAVSDKLFNGLVPWLNRIPGKLLHINVFACSLFAAVSGSSAATTATVGKITLDELSKRGYSESMALGSLAGAGTLGFMIPPSLIMIIYGILSDTSIGQLFIGGIFPGLLLAGGYSFYIALRAIVTPDIVPSQEESFTWAQRFRSLRDLAPVLFLIAVVLGGIYLGYTTPTEAAAIGVLGAFVLGVLFRTMSWSIFKDALWSAVRTSTMITFIIVGAAFLSQVVGFLGITTTLSRFIADLHLSPYMLIFILGLMYIFLGMLLDGISLVVMTLPIVLPMILHAGFSPLWFGIFLVFMVELSQITPPVGFSIFVLQSMSHKDVGFILKATFPFFVIMVVTVVLVTVFPQIALFLPQKMIG
ncbi:TRAP transporter large permease [Desulfosoma caldarium]|uniref:Tripartite ATP-independent transporter DctM subunit n=1 Tax=Desulfosoma caldarium TaxID=610254 RepID=A0A3N1VJM0_9BACT|nr:TRAP transporter large permease subunit [Desulfosoma caldarium]ROR03003.1 tripartite ATP-independent transporter DctM subunit [Desulfosoma caldarium]